MPCPCPTRARAPLRCLPRLLPLPWRACDLHRPCAAWPRLRGTLRNGRQHQACDRSARGAAYRGGNGAGQRPPGAAGRSAAPGRARGGPSAFRPSPSALPSLPPRFVADAHLGGLARLLRLAGFDTLYDNRIEDAALVATACASSASCSPGTANCSSAGTSPRAASCMRSRPSTRRSRSSGASDSPLRPSVLALPRMQRGPAGSRLARCRGARAFPAVRARHTRFSACPGCGRVYWEGSHWTHMRARIDAVLAQAHAAPGDEAAD